MSCRAQKLCAQDAAGNRDAGRKRPHADKKSCPAKKTPKPRKQEAACAVPSTCEEPLLNADDAVCCVCGSGENEERMILCDKCPLAFHLECLSPPLDAVPEGDWFCSRCQSAVDTGQEGKKSARKAAGKGGQAGSNKKLTARSGPATGGGRQQTKAKTAFELFFLDQKDELLAAVKGESFGAIQKKVKQAWEDLSPAEQEEWHAKSKRLEAASVDGRGSEGNEGKTSSKAKAQKSLASPADHAQAKGSKKVPEETGGKSGRTGCAVQKGGAVKRKMDSHDSDPNWLGFVFDPASLEPLAEVCSVLCAQGSSERASERVRECASADCRPSSLLVGKRSVLQVRRHCRSRQPRHGRKCRLTKRCSHTRLSGTQPAGRTWACQPSCIRN